MFEHGCYFSSLGQRMLERKNVNIKHLCSSSVYKRARKV